VIHQILEIVTQKLDIHLRDKYALPDSKVLLSNMTDSSGQTIIEGTNKVICTLVNVAEERVYKRLHEKVERKNDFAYYSAPIHLNLQLLVSAYFTKENYAEALKFLSEIIIFFQINHSIHHENTPEFKRLSQPVKLNVEMMSLDLNQLTQLWSILGVKYMPSVLYHLRMVSLPKEGIIKYTVPKMPIPKKTVR